MIENDRAGLEELRAVAKEHEEGEILIRELREGFREILEKKGKKISTTNVFTGLLWRGLGGDRNRLSLEGKVGVELPMPFAVQSSGMDLSKRDIIVDIRQSKGRDHVYLVFEPDGSLRYAHPDRHGFYDISHRQRPTIDELRPYKAMLGMIKEELGIEES